MVTKIEYINEDNKTSNRQIEPFALISTQENWLLVAWCRLRKGFRYFRLDRIKKVEILTDDQTIVKKVLEKEIQNREEELKRQKEKGESEK